MPDEKYPRRAIELAAEARAGGNARFGSLLVGADGRILAEERNTTITDRDISAHPEQKLAPLGGARAGPGHRGGHHDVHELPAVRHVHGRTAAVRLRAGGVRFVGGAAGEPEGADRAGRRASGTAGGAFLFDEARVPVEGYYR